MTIVSTAELRAAAQDRRQAEVDAMSDDKWWLDVTDEWDRQNEEDEMTEASYDKLADGWIGGDK